MSDAGARFDTTVEHASGSWPRTPEYWSSSSLKEIESCPRRWMLSRATYPEVWASRGYPQVPGLAALFGDVVHETLEVVVSALNRAGCTATDTADAVGVIRDLGGLSTVIRAAIDRKVTALVDNPRMSDEARNTLHQALVDQLGVASNRVQVFLSRGTLPAWAAEVAKVGPGSAPAQAPQGPPHRTAVGSGAHPEVDVVAEGLRLWGRIDLLTVDDSGVTITDFKTGQDDPLHDEQVRLYALLWSLDRQANPARREVTALVVSYPGRDRAVPAPDEAALRALEASVAARIADADAETTTAEPRALPSPDNCAFCHVRHMCEEYWQHVAPPPASVPPREWFDIEGTVLRQNGIKSWVVEAAEGGTEVLVRTPSPSNTLPVGQRVRVLGVRKVEDPDRPELVIAALGSGSETFVLKGGAS